MSRQRADEGIRDQGFVGPDVPSFEILNTCVKCGLCLPTCPTYQLTMREQSSPRGRIHLMQGVHEGRIGLLDPTFVGQMEECLDCRACEAVCPSGVRYGEVLERARAQIERGRTGGKRHPLWLRALRMLVFRAILGDMRTLRAVAAALRLYQRSGLQALSRGTGLLRPEILSRLDSQMPRVSSSFFTPLGQVYAARGERRGRAALLAGCVMQTAFAEVHRATVRLLTKNGWEVVVPAEQGCCGALHIHAGEIEGGRRLARRNIAAFEAAGVDLVVNNSAGCGAAMKEYDRLLDEDPRWSARAAVLVAKVRDVTELLAEQPLRGAPRALPLRVTYQDACHLLHAQRVSSEPRALLAQCPGLELIEMDEPALCCGSAGSYSLTHPRESRALLARKLDRARSTGASVIATANPGCMLQLQAGLRGRAGGSETPRQQVRHVVELLDAAFNGTADS